MTKFTATDYISAFRKIRRAPHHQMMLQENYYAPNKTLTAATMAKALGYYKYTAANLHYGKLACLVGEELGWNPVPKFKLEILVDFEKRDGEWHWIMKPEVAEAIERLGWVDDKQLKTPEEIDENEPIFEGATKRVTVNAYERSSAARARCILHYGCKCAVCGVVLSDVYGEIAQGFIHVHHLRQLSEINAKYQVDPIKDLRPICPTCHAIIHLKKPPYSVEEVREIIKDKND